MSQLERRHHRSANTSQALCLQLQSSLHKAGLSAMLLADEEGVCLAAAGDDDACDEIAAQLPMMGRKVPSFEGVLFGPMTQWDISMQKVEVDGSKLFLCAVGQSEARNDEMANSMSGIARILHPAAV